MNPSFDLFDFRPNWWLSRRLLKLSSDHIGAPDARLRGLLRGWIDPRAGVGVRTRATIASHVMTIYHARSESTPLIKNCRWVEPVEETLAHTLGLDRSKAATKELLDLLAYELLEWARFNSCQFYWGRLVVRGDSLRAFYGTNTQTT